MGVFKLYAPQYVCRPGCMMQVRLAVLRPAARLGAAARYADLSIDVPSQAHELISARSVALCGAARCGVRPLCVQNLQASSSCFPFSGVAALQGLWFVARLGATAGYL